MTHSEFTIGKVGDIQLTPQEQDFLKDIARGGNLFDFLTTNKMINVEYDSSKHQDYRTFLSDTITKYQEAHQTLRRLMAKSPFIMTPKQIAYTIIDDDEIPKTIGYGSKISLGYKMLILTPSYDIGQNKSLIELSFPYPVKIIPINRGEFLLMDENHIFKVEGMERRTLKEHPSHGHLYHLDIYRLASTNEVKIPGDEPLTKRFRLHIRDDEKQNVTVHKTIWKKNQSTKRRGNEDDFEAFKRNLIAGNSSASTLRDDTLHKLYLVSYGIKDLTAKILFKIHTHRIKLDHMVDQFYLKDIQDVSYADLEDKLKQTMSEISGDLDRHFVSTSKVSNNKFTLFNSCTSKHFDGLDPGKYVRFDNFLTGYTSTDSIFEKLEKKSTEVILVFRLPPGTPVIIMQDHTKKTKFHNVLVLPRNMTFYIEEIKGTKISENPKTFRETYVLGFSRSMAKKPREDLDHFIVINHDNLEHISKTT